MRFFRRKKPDGATVVSTDRLEVFSDGVIAIIITIMALELKAPHDAGAAALIAQWPIFASYAVSFFYISVYWINHHHLLHFAKASSGAVIWANLFFLFCLSLIPFATAYVGESRISLTSAVFYALIMLVSSFAFLLLRIAIQRHDHGHGLARIMKTEGTKRNWLAFLVHLASVPAAFVHPGLTILMTLCVGIAYAAPPSWEKNPFDRVDA